MLDDDPVEYYDPEIERVYGFASLALAQEFRTEAEHRKKARKKQQRERCAFGGAFVANSDAVSHPHRHRTEKPYFKNDHGAGGDSKSNPTAGALHSRYAEGGCRWEDPRQSMRNVGGAPAPAQATRTSITRGPAGALHSRHVEDRCRWANPRQSMRSVGGASAPVQTTTSTTTKSNKRKQKEANTQTEASSSDATEETMTQEKAEEKKAKKQETAKGGKAKVQQTSAG